MSEIFQLEFVPSQQIGCEPYLWSISNLYTSLFSFMVLVSPYGAIIEISLAYWKQIKAPNCRCQNHSLLITAILGSYSSDNDYAFHCSWTATLTQPCTQEVVPRLDGCHWLTTSCIIFLLQYHRTMVGQNKWLALPVWHLFRQARNCPLCSHTLDYCSSVMHAWHWTYCVYCEM